MISKIIYFRPDKRFVEEDLLNKKYCCTVRDEFTCSDNCITVPNYLTVLQHISPKAKRKSRKHDIIMENGHNNHEFLEKICFHLIGSSQAPSLHQFMSNLDFVDRIEFHGHLGFEEPIFNVISQLPNLRKISFVVHPCKQGQFKGSSNGGKDDNIGPSKPFVHSSVTCFKMIVKDCNPDSTCTDCNAASLNLNKMDGLRIMLTQILNRTAKHCPNIKRLSMDVPYCKEMQACVDKNVDELKKLKPTSVSTENDRIIVKKTSESPVPFLPEPEVKASTLVVEPEATLTLEHTNESGNLVPEIRETEEANETCVRKEHSPSGIFEKNDDLEELDHLEGTPCLVDMSKLLGSMLGIPTSSSLGDPASAPQSSQPSIKLPLSNHNGSNNTNNKNINLSTDKKSTTTSMSLTASSPSEVISYAAAAASNASNNKHKHLRGTGNDSQQQKGSNEGSRRTFLHGGDNGIASFEGSVAHVEESGKRSNIDPSIADLGKPVFGTSSTRHIKA